MKTLCALAAMLLTAGCLPLQPPPEPQPDPNLAALTDQISALRADLAALELQLGALRSDQLSVVDQLDLNIDSVDLLTGRVEALPDALRSLCPPPAARTFQCPPPEIRRVMVAEDKMVVGELEQIWLEPPGVSLTARIDTGVSGNALHAQDIVEFERDGAQWVRFSIFPAGNGDVEPVEMERAALRYMRVTAGDATGARRPVVAMRVRLGDVHTSFEFTVSERPRTGYDVLLGRSFLTDIALVDVGRQFVQPRYVPQRPRTPDNSDLR